MAIVHFTGHSDEFRFAKEVSDLVEKAYADPNRYGGLIVKYSSCVKENIICYSVLIIYETTD